MTGIALLGLGIAAIAVLLVLVIWARVPAFLALLIVAITTQFYQEFHSLNQ